MEIGTIGAGALAQAFAKRVLKAGYKVKLSNSRGPKSLRNVIKLLGSGAMAVKVEEAAKCQIVLLAVPWDNVPEILSALPKWKNQILIDETNPFHGKAGTFTPANVGNLSTSQLVAALAPGARVVKAFNNTVVGVEELQVRFTLGSRIPVKANIDRGTGKTDRAGGEDGALRADRRQTGPAIGAGLRTNTPLLAKIGETVCASIRTLASQHIIGGHPDVGGWVNIHADRACCARANIRSGIVVDRYCVALERPVRDRLGVCRGHRTSE